MSRVADEGPGVDPGIPEHGFRAIVEALPVAVFTCGPNGRLTYYNEAAAQLLGGRPRLREPPQAVGLRFLKADASEYSDEEFPWVRALMHNAPVFSADGFLERPDGSRRRVVAFAAPLLDNKGASWGTVSQVIDVTHRRSRQAEEAELLRSVFQQAPGFMALLTGPEHRFSMANEAYLKLVNRHDVLSKTVLEALPEVESQGFLGLLDEVYDTGTAFVGHAMRIVLGNAGHQAPQEVFVDFVYQPLRDEHDTVTGILVQGHDVTVQHRASTALAEQAAELNAALTATQMIMDHALDVICTVDANGAFVDVSRSSQAVWGYAPAELRGRRYIDLVHPEDVEATNAFAVAMMSGRQAASHQNRYRHKDGHSVTMMWKSVWSDSQQLVFATARDMTERLHAEEQLRHAQRLEAVGRLTGGLAHDFNNLLTVVLGNAEALTEALEHAPELRELAALTLEAGERGATLISRLLSFARQQPLASEPTDVLALLRDLQPLLRNAVGPDVQLKISGVDGSKPSLVDRVQLESAILNLSINARDAMPQGGDLSIEVQTLQIDNLPTPLPAGEYTRIIVRDTGEGMSSEIVARAFDPFFTTKRAGQGSGLGLSMVHGFVHQSGGHLAIRSQPGVGTSVSLYLPVTTIRVSASSASSAAEQAQPASSVAHVLVVDDEKMLRDQVERQLKSLGYQVTTCEGARAALQRLAKDPSIEVLFTDVVMPGGQSGRELVRQAHSIRPDVVSILTSGYQDEGLGSDTLAIGTPLLRKPYRKSEIARALHLALSSRVVGPRQ